ncbi:xanthine phosphoribosyltransferase [Clostridium sporogenes]|uniref:xanthine phosphoribosyltransferase n=1 Tax=Clostridium TaxID=1485 RepID=UPI00090BAB23|nr:MULTISPECIES: xanthine phosphoribosyltransferase [Clostridium]APF25402.1 xanthine phosphoribosyltransferase [Clostridium sporogenes]MDI6920963.1 xanthine phosphoribosyltransferase [Clostridium botulinum]WMU98846.1 xanthine phosphoribosyltransferase [Clostridium botulinum]
MKLLEDKILKEGTLLEENILKVDSFLNHQMDVKLFNEMGKEFKRRFEGYNINKILTIEASGIGIATIVSQYFDFCPVVFAKKVDAANMDKDTYESKVHSFTKNKTYNVRVSKKYINEGDKILLIDDFLANGCAALGLIDIIKQGGAELAGVGIAIEKGFQKGRRELEKVGAKVESLAILDKIENGKVYFK